MMAAKNGGEREGDTHAPGCPNIYQRYLKACEVIDSMPWIKDQSNPQFKSVPIDAMRAGVRKACIIAGMVHHGPSQMDYTREVEVRKDKVGNEVGKTFRYHGEAKFRLINVDDPSDYMEWETIGESMDTGDKGISKLKSSFIKNFYKAAFDIGEKGDDTDSYSNEEFDEFIAKKREEVEKAHQAAEQGNREMEAKRQTILDNADHPVVKAFIEQHGGRPAKWSDLDVIQCLIDLEDAKKISQLDELGEAIKNCRGQAKPAEDVKGAEVAAEEQIGQDAVGEKMAEHYGIDIQKAKTALIRFHNQHIIEEPNPVLAKHIEDNGGTFMANWSTSTIIACYQEMVNRGFIQEGSA